MALDYQHRTNNIRPIPCCHEMIQFTASDGGIEKNEGLIAVKAIQSRGQDRRCDQERGKNGDYD